LRGEKDELRKLLSSDTLLRRLLVREIKADAEKYGDERRTLIEASATASRAEVAAVADEPVTLIVSEKGWARARAGHGLDLSGVAYKDGDGPGVAYECRTVDSLVILSDEGRAFTVPVSALPDGRGLGAPLSSFVDLGSGRIAHVLAGKAEDEFLIAKTSGYGFVCAFGDLVSRQKAGKAFLTMEDGAVILPPSPVAGMDHVAALSGDGRLLIFPLDQMKRLSGGKGVQIIGLKGKETLRSAIATKGFLVRIRGTFRNRQKELLSEEKHVGQRARRGALVGPVNSPTIHRLAEPNRD
ncbi:MAG: DNA topoisomerase IV subunit A, partial [Candidatus Accumulibacter sp.]|nr:DNA topoisomerase IV subunit A [Accumulibacter sp.]